MAMEKEREYRALQDFTLVPRESETDAYRVRGTAVDIPAYQETSISARSFFEVEREKEAGKLEQKRRRLTARIRNEYKQEDESNV